MPFLHARVRREKRALVKNIRAPNAALDPFFSRIGDIRRDKGSLLKDGAN